MRRISSRRRRASARRAALLSTAVGSVSSIADAAPAASPGFEMPSDSRFFCCCASMRCCARLPPRSRRWRFFADAAARRLRSATADLVSAMVGERSVTVVSGRRSTQFASGRSCWARSIEARMAPLRSASSPSAIGSIVSTVGVAPRSSSASMSSTARDATSASTSSRLRTAPEMGASDATSALAAPSSGVGSNTPMGCEPAGRPFAQSL
mmetsp:Transcript_12346/g.38417  ORF Transcript_12346/g.38417 Transcript_12346/m.38417 type:complete len:210 (-) Transcript_12346:672-1301(-)